MRRHMKKRKKRVIATATIPMAASPNMEIITTIIMTAVKKSFRHRMPMTEDARHLAKK